MSVLLVFAGIVIGRFWRWTVDFVATRQFQLAGNPSRQFAYYGATAMVSGAMFSFLPCGPAPFTQQRLLFHAGLCVGFVVVKPFLAGSSKLRLQNRKVEALAYLLGISALTIIALGGGYLLGSQDQLPPP